jgi:5S rRNA maturation endonuclease (ribonuclease M5)
MTSLIDVLKDKGITYVNTNNPMEIKISCTSGEHVDSDPSLRYNLDKNVFFCFSCGFKGGVIKFLESIGIIQKLHIESKQEYKILKLKRKLQQIKNADNIKLPIVQEKFGQDFNGARKETMLEFKAFVTTEYNLENYVCIPVYQFGRLKFLDARRRIPDLKLPKYIRKPDSTVISDVMFPIDKIAKTNHVILVEGMFDMLNLWQHGVRNVLCIFGANNFNKDKIKLLNAIGVTKITLMMDGDKAGQNAANRIEKLLEDDFFLTNKIVLDPDKDPGSLTQEEVRFYLKN